MSELDPKEVVRRGYDQVSHAYRGDTIGRKSDYQVWLDELTPLLKPGDPVLDLGCGCGIPVAKELADNFLVTGVDFSEVQIARARQLVPRGNFICEDMGTCQFPPFSFAAILSFYALIHLPLAEQQPSLARCLTWLQPGGYLLMLAGHHAWTGGEIFHGAPMWWSHADEATYLGWLREIGYSIQWTRFIPEDDSGFSLIFARRPFEKSPLAVPRITQTHSPNFQRFP